jgi:signal transduction histidine kinase
MLAGVVFGACFPLVGILVAGGWPLDFAAAHGEQSVLYIVDSAPIVLGGVGALIGRVYGRLYATRRAIEARVMERTAELRDAITELERTQGQLVQAQKLEAIGSLAAGVAHEINTPIQFVGDNTRFLDESFGRLSVFHRAAIELAEAARGVDAVASELERFDHAVEDADLDFLAEEIPSAVAQAREGVGRVAEIVQALKSFAHPGMESKSPVNINKAVTDTLAVSRSEWKYIADVRTDLDHDLPQVPALAGPLNQALLILIVNAAQAMEDHLAGTGGKGTIAITTSVEDDAVVISVEDDAGGIPEEIQDRIFDPFFTTKEVGRGSGQGLSIARSVIVEQHDGDLSFEVRPGEGTTFHMRLPLQDAA